MKLLLLNLSCIFLFLLSFSESQPSKFVQDSLSNLIPSNQPKPYCVKNPGSSTTPPCSVSIDEYSGGFEEPGSKVHPNNAIFPPWMNLTLARRGQAFANDYLFCNIMSHGFGLLATITNPLQISDVLISTRNSDTGERATYRYFATLTQVANWYQGDLADMVNTATSTSLRKVRDLHLSAAKTAKDTLDRGRPLVPESYFDNLIFNTQLWKAFYDDLENSDIPQEYRTFTPDIIEAISNSDVPVNQVQQGFTQFAFIGLPILYPRRCGIGMNATDDDFLAFNHLWAVLGYGLGIKDEYNIALQPDLTAVKEYYQNIYNKYFLPVLFNSNKNATKVLGEAVFKALEAYTTEYGLTTNTFMYLFLKQIINIPAQRLYGLLSDAEKAVAGSIETQYLPMIISNPSYRATANTAVINGFQLLGMKYFGAKYSSLQTRANEVYYP